MKQCAPIIDPIIYRKKAHGLRIALTFTKNLHFQNQHISVVKCLILMLNLKVSKQKWSEASTNKVIIKIVSNISINKVNLSK